MQCSGKCIKCLLNTRACIYRCIPLTPDHCGWMLITGLYVSDASNRVTRSLTYRGSQICSCQTQGRFFYFIEKGVGLKTLLSQRKSLPLIFAMKHLYESREYASQYILSACSLRLLLVSLTDSILSHQSIKLTTPCNGYQATFLYNVVHTGFILNVQLEGVGG